jgi:hypothetical protein
VRPISLSLAIFLSIGCAQGPKEKSFYSFWKSKLGAELDLRYAEFDINKSINVIMNESAVCKCDAAFSGDGHFGGFHFGPCGYDSGGNGDPGCDSLAAIGSYERHWNELTMCSESACVTYY